MNNKMLISLIITAGLGFTTQANADFTPSWNIGDCGMQGSTLTTTSGCTSANATLQSMSSIIQEVKTSWDTNFKPTPQGVTTSGGGSGGGGAAYTPPTTAGGGGGENEIDSNATFD